jgi:hypothetical protein
MSGEVERYRQRQRERLDPREDAYRAGYELMQRQAELAQMGEEDPFNQPFFAQGFQQGQTKRETKHKRTVHNISETEYILTEETTTTETFSFGNSIYKEQ